jgi:hypothetical protein
MKLLSWVIAAASVLACAMNGSASSDQADELWTRNVEPLLDRNCFKCHGGVRQKSGLDLRSLVNLLKGGDRGPAVVPGHPEESHLLQFVLPGADPHMPSDARKQLRESEIEVIRDWIQALPGTNIVTVAPTDPASWAEVYAKAYVASKVPVWVPAEGLPVHEVIDRFVELGWKKRDVVPSGPGDDATYARRVYLDLAGRIPSWEELDHFVKESEPGKRALLADRLLGGEDYPRHMREVFDVVLLERANAEAEIRRRDHGWFAFLERAFKSNYPWGRIVRDLVLARGSDAEDHGAVCYLYERHNNYQAMAEALAPVAFGVQIGCAQCHNHPLASEVEQRHYWGLVAAFNRSKNIESASSWEISESAIGGFINFANLKKESQPAQLAFLNGVTVSEQRPGEGEKETDDPDKYAVPPPKDQEKPGRAAIPKFSRREALADAVTHGNPQLALAFVNRIWAMLMGRGLLEPIDQMDSRHHASHPDLLNWLAHDFEEHGYDIKRLLRELVLSRTYQLDSRPRGEKAPPPDTFARMLEKPLSGEQLARSILIATGNARDGQAMENDAEREIRHAVVSRFPELFQTEYSASLQQATFVSNSPILDRLLQRREQNTTARLLAEDSEAERIRMTFRFVLGREPDVEEESRCLAFLQTRSVEAGTRHLLWALLASTEFQMNH